MDSTMAFKIQKIKSYSGILYIYGFNCCKNIKKYVDWLNLKFIMHESLFFYLKNAIIKIRGSAEKLTLEKGSAQEKDLIGLLQGAYQWKKLLAFKTSHFMYIKACILK